VIGMNELVLGGRYRLEELLGTGGMSVVWRARDEVLGRMVAVKVLSGGGGGPAARQRIHDEARSAAAVSHPNLAQVFDFGESSDGTGGGTPYVVMELIDGETLERRIAAGPPPPAETLRICAEVAAGLAAAHAAGLVHRDVKPGNIMLTAAGAKLVDFGIAASVDKPGPFTPGEEVLGTPAYVAPERLTTGAVTPASDVYALGVLLYRLLAGVPPWSAATTTQLIRDHIYTAPDPLPDLPGVPAPVARLCMNCLAKDPDARPRAELVAAVLAEAEDGLFDPPPDRRRGRLILTGAAVAGLAAAWLLSGATPLNGTAPWAQAEADPPAAASSPAPPSSPTAGAAPLTSGSRTTPPPAATPIAAPAASGPAARTTTTSPPPPTPSPTPVPLRAGTRLTSPGGSVVATCTDGDRAELSSWEPATSYKVKTVRPGPAKKAGIVFRNGNTLVEMVVTCTGGTPSATTTTEQR
jgi:serine/threonine protein kinase